MSTSVWPYSEIPGLPGVYVCGCLERWVSIHLQAIRALNLAWALVAERRVEPGARVCVIGGGFAGLTLAAGLGRLGARVTLLERNAQLLAAQRNNRVRWIHPHIHEWPRPGSLEARAGLPLLDWHAGRSADMAGEVLAGFEREVARSRIEVVTGARAPALDGTSVRWEGHAAERFDAVVLALGVGIEKSFGALPLRSYWADEEIATVRAGPPRHHLVTGIGEGGVIDALYLRLAGFSHAGVAAKLSGLEGMAPVERALLELEQELEGLADAPAGELLQRKMAALPVPPAVDALLSSMLRGDTRVTLNGPEPYPLAPRADVLNRLLVSRLVKLGAIEYRPGKIADIAADGARWRVTFDDGAALTFDEVNIRHGTVPTLKTGFPALWDRYEPVRRALPHLTPTPQWPAGAWLDEAKEKEITAKAIALVRYHLELLNKGDLAGARQQLFFPPGMQQRPLDVYLEHMRSLTPLQLLSATASVTGPRAAKPWHGAFASVWIDVSVACNSGEKTSVFIVWWSPKTDEYVITTKPSEWVLERKRSSGAARGGSGEEG